MTLERATNEIGPAHQLLDGGRTHKHITIPANLIGSPGQALHVWACIKDYADRGLDLPKTEVIARRCALSPTVVTRAMMWLRREGWLA